MTSQNVCEVAGVLPPGALQPLWTAIGSGLFDRVSDEVNALLAHGYSMTMMARGAMDLIVSEPGLNEVQRARMLLKLAQVDKSLVDGADEELQMLDVFGEFAVIWTQI